LIALTDYPAIDLQFEPGSDGARIEALLYAALDDFQPLAIQEHESADGWLVFFRDALHRDGAAAALRALEIHPSLTLTSLDVPDEDWARRSQANLRAITVGRITVARPWDVPDAAFRLSDPGSRIPDPVTDHIVIVIDPSMGFGTGHHQTTRLCLSLLQSIEIAGRRLIDVGTGSGVLAIAAATLGARSVTAMDNDSDALHDARGTSSATPSSSRSSTWRRSGGAGQTLPCEPPPRFCGITRPRCAGCRTARLLITSGFSPESWRTRRRRSTREAPPRLKPNGRRRYWRVNTST
jgi:hypothetical protein